MQPLRQRFESLWPWAVLPFLCAGAMHAQRGFVDDASRKTPPESWRSIALAEAGVEIAIPRDFERLPAQPLRPLRFRGNLGGGKVELEVAWLTKNFATVSRVLLGLAADSTLLRVDAGRADGLVTAVCERELVGTKHRRIGYIICPRREAILVECDIPKSAPSTTSGAARELLRFVRLVERTGLTAVQFGEEERLRRRIEAGFVEADRKKVEIRQSTFYRLFTTAPVDETILEFLEAELLPRVVAICGESPSRTDPLSLFVHRGRSNYILASMQLGLSAQQGEAMAGHAWDDNYATWFEHARSAVHVHEGTHQYMTATLGLDGGGPWLQEGFARWIETQYSHELPARNARNLLRSRKDFPKLEALISERSFLSGGGGRLGYEALQLYDISASFVRYLAQEHRAKFRTILLRTGVLPSGEFRLVARALEDTIGIAFPKLEEDWHRWLREDL